MEFQCSSFSVGSSYNLDQISKYILSVDKDAKLKSYASDVLLVSSEAFSLKPDRRIFIYEYGCLVFWGLDESEESKVIARLKRFLNEGYKEAIVDRCKYEVRDESSSDSYVDHENDKFIISGEDNCVYLAFSYAMSQSIKIGYFEKSVQKTIEDNKEIPASLIKTGKTFLSRAALSKKIGRLFYEKNSVNLNRYILNTPEFFWKKPKYEVYYEDANKFMDISHRTNILNNKIDVTNELYMILAAELHHAHSMKLEIVIIILISIEVVFSVLKPILHWL